MCCVGTRTSSWLQKCDYNYNLKCTGTHLDSCWGGTSDASSHRLLPPLLLRCWPAQSTSLSVSEAWESMWQRLSWSIIGDFKSGDPHLDLITLRTLNPLSCALFRTDIVSKKLWYRFYRHKRTMDLRELIISPFKHKKVMLKVKYQIRCYYLTESSVDSLQSTNTINSPCVTLRVWAKGWTFLATNVYTRKSHWYWGVHIFSSSPLSCGGSNQGSTVFREKWNNTCSLIACPSSSSPCKYLCSSC